MATRQQIWRRLRANIPDAQSNGDAAGFMGIAKEHGYELTAEHKNQLSEEECEGVAGGNLFAFAKAVVEGFIDPKVNKRLSDTEVSCSGFGEQE